MKLNLNHQKVTSLTPSEMGDIHGGGIKRSNRRTGNCRYSRNHPQVVMCCGEPKTLGCLASIPNPNAPSGS